jgi:hypothetical protein
MNVFEQVQQPFARIFSSQIAMVLILSTLLWMTGAPLLLNNADAAQLTNVSDTLTDSDPGVATRHVVRFTTATSTVAGQAIRITLDPATSAFSQAFSTATTADMTASGMTVVNDAADCDAGAPNDQVYPVGNYNNGSNEYIDFTVCPADSLGSGSKQINIGTTTALFTNPSSPGSYRIVIGGTWDDDGETRVAIIDDVVVTASVDTTFTFTISGITSTSTIPSVNGETLTGTTTATALPFGTLAPGVAKTLGQQLNVTTNAAGGFSVTVVEDTNLQSATGADIDLFSNGATTSTPIAWTAPTNTLGQEWTYGHIGVTSDDASLSAGDEFGAQLFAGNFNTARQVFYHNGPSDGTTNSIGSTTVAFKVQIGSLQEAGNDYTNTLTYVATPTF